MTGKNPNQSEPNTQSPRVESENPSGAGKTNRSSEPNRTREGGPRFDDRPNPRRENSPPDSTTKERSQEKPGPGPGLPDYGDQEPGDPRRIEIESRRRE